MNTLITIPFSHFCEKARWALDFVDASYQERSFLPGLHLTGTVLRGRGKTVPVLQTGDECLTDSSDIVQWADQHRGRGVTSLLGSNEAERTAILALEDRLDKNLGPAARLYAYFYLLDDLPLLTRLVGDSYRPAARAALQPFMGLMRSFIRKGYRIHSESAAKAADRMQKLFAELDTLRAPGQRYLVGSQFSAADLTLAALAQPVLLWPEGIYRADGRRDKDDPIRHLPEPYAAFVRTLRDTATGQLCRELYQDKRRPS
jgi:glutathione S-transferase